MSLCIIDIDHNNDMIALEKTFEMRSKVPLHDTGVILSCLCGSAGRTQKSLKIPQYIRPMFKLRISKFGVWVKQVFKRRRWIFLAHRLFV